MDHRTIDLKSDPSFKATYQSLLANDWSMASLRGTLDLMDEALRGSRAQIRFTWEKTATPQKSDAWVFDITAFRGLLADHRKFRAADIPKIPEDTSELFPATSPLADAAIRSSIYLDLQRLCDLRGDLGFFRDLQSLLFLNAVDSLLPELRDKNMHDYADLLVNVLDYHATYAWRDDPAHQQFLLSTLAHDLGDRSREETALLAAFRLTDPQDHDYLTLAQTYWAFLTDGQRYKEAERFLLNVYRNAPREHLSEVQELIDETFAESATSKL